MKNYFLQIKHYVEESCPELRGNVDGILYPPTKQAEIISSITSSLWFFGLILLFAGDAVFGALGIEHPAFYAYMRQTKMQCGFILFMINNFGAGMLATGAFEVYLDEDLIYSKLETGRMPKLPDIFYALAMKGIKVIEQQSE